jgi:hypothetical protein
MKRVLALFLGLSPWAADAQTLPVLAPAHVQLITQEISGDAAYEHLRFTTQFHKPSGGADGLMEVARYVERMAGAYGLTEVRLIKQTFTGRRPWNATFADLWLVGPQPERLTSTIRTPLSLADNSQRADIAATIVDVGAGVEEGDYAGKGVEGRLVLAHGSLSQVMSQAVWARKAAGIIWFPDPSIDRNISYPDQVNWSGLPQAGPNQELPTFAFVLSVRQGLALRARVAAASEPLQARALVEAGFTSAEGSEPWQVMVEGVIPGADPALAQDIVLTAHMQEEKFSANDDGTGLASTLEIARALQRLMADGRLPRPRRTLRFWWVTEISSQRQYFADNLGSHRRFWVNVNQDMAGVNQAQDVMRAQNVTRLPASRFHFFNDVVEAVIDYMVASNTAELAQAQAGSGNLYPRPHLAALGSRHRFNAKMIFFHNNTDHMAFNEAPIGVPGVTFTNWPDHYIHTTDDDLWNIDRTQLGRSAASAALMAYTMASADAASAPTLAAQTAGRGAERVARNLALGLAWIAGEADKAAAYRRGVEQVAYAGARELMAVSSLGSIAPEAQKIVAAMGTALARRVEQARFELATAYQTLTGQMPPALLSSGTQSGAGRPGSAPPVGAGLQTGPASSASGAELKLAATRPVLMGDAVAFLAGRSQMAAVAGLHPLMAFEVLNFVDGARSGLEIYRMVASEAREAGPHYYGTVTPEAVLQCLENAAKPGLIRLQ